MSRQPHECERALMKLEEILKDVRVGEQTVLDVAGEGKEKKLTVELRKLLPEAPRAPIRAESPPKNHTFHAAESLGTYLKQYGSEKSVVFADTEEETIWAVLDETAKDGFEIVTMEPQIHPLWKPWADKSGTAIPLEDFARFVAENRRSIVAPGGRELSMLLAQVRAVVSVEIQRGRGKNAVNGLMVTTKIQGVEKKEPVELPDTLVIEVPLYVGTSRRAIELDLCIEADRDGEVTVLVSSGTVAEAKVNAFEEMCGVLTAMLTEKQIPITLGAPAHDEWKYLPEQAPR